MYTRYITRRGVFLQPCFRQTSCGSLSVSSLVFKRFLFCRFLSVFCDFMTGRSFIWRKRELHSQSNVQYRCLLLHAQNHIPFREVLASAGSEDTSENFLFCNVTANEKEKVTLCQVLAIHLYIGSASTRNGKYLHQVYYETIFGLFCET